MRKAVAPVLALLMLVGAGVLVWLYFDATGEPENTPAPAADLVLEPDEARKIADTTAHCPNPGEVSLCVPEAGISSHIQSQGIVDGYMSLPKDLSLTGWLTTTASLDQNTTEGSTLLAGHVQYAGQNGVLYPLGNSEPGQTISTFDNAGVETKWVIIEVKLFNKQSLPTEIFQPEGVERQLNVVTCGGEIHQGADGWWYHDSNIVVTALPLDP